MDVKTINYDTDNAYHLICQSGDKRFVMKKVAGLNGPRFSYCVERFGDPATDKWTGVAGYDMDIIFSLDMFMETDRAFVDEVMDYLYEVNCWSAKTLKQEFVKDHMGRDLAQYTWKVDSCGQCGRRHKEELVSGFRDNLPIKLCVDCQ